MRYRFPACAWVALVAATVVPASAQTPRPERPYRGLFGGGVGDVAQSLIVNASIGGGTSDSLLTGDPVVVGEDTIDVRQAREGGYGQMSGGLTYSINGEALSFRTSAASSARYFPDLTDTLLASHSGSVGAGWQITSRTRLEASASVSYQPLDLLTLFPDVFAPEPGTALPGNQDFGGTRRDTLTADGSVRFSRELTRRISGSLDYSARRSNLGTVGLDADQDQIGHTYGGGLRFGIARGLGLRAVYGETRADYEENVGVDPETGAPVVRKFRARNYDVGIDFNRALSVSRRTTLSFATGTAAVSDGQRTRYWFTGSASLNHEIGRTWSAGLTYSRGVDYQETLRNPTFSDSVNLGVNGLITRKLSLRVNVGGAVGAVGVVDEDEADDFTSVVGSLSLGYALNRHVSLGVDYSYYQYEFDAGTFLPPGAFRRLERQSVSASVRFWAPLFERARRPNASR